MTRSELRNMPNDELTELLADVLYAMMLQAGEKADHILPDGIQLKTETENLKITFDIDIDIDVKNSGYKAFKDFVDKYSCHIYKPGELDE